MRVRTITVTEAAYRRLRALRAGSESFTDVGLRLTERGPLAEFAGAISPGTADALRAAIEEDRRRRRHLDD